MSEQELLQASVAQRFQEYLVANDLRQTRERYAILKAVYEMEGLFTIEDLLDFMTQHRFPVSRATLYNNTLLLVQANLLMRHPFSSQGAVFERITDLRPRSYQVCSHCHRITLIRSKELATCLEGYRPRRFTPTHRVVYVYGTCPKCEAAMRKKLRQLQHSATNQ